MAHLLFFPCLGLEGKEGTIPVSSLKLKSNLFWIHLTSFVAFGGPQSYRASMLAHLAIVSLLRDLDDEASDMSDKASKLYNLLVFLWAIEKGYVTSIPIGDPPATNEFDTPCGRIMGKLSAATEDPKTKQDKSDKSQSQDSEKKSQGDPSRSHRSKSKSSFREWSPRRSRLRSRLSHHRSRPPKKTGASATWRGATVATAGTAPQTGTGEGPESRQLTSEEDIAWSPVQAPYPTSSLAQAQIPGPEGGRREESTDKAGEATPPTASKPNTCRG